MFASKSKYIISYTLSKSKGDDIDKKRDNWKIISFLLYFSVN